MAFVITEPCKGVKDAGCIAVCPVDCIHPTKDEADFPDVDMLYIDPAVCIDCGLCVDECPVKAIYPEHQVPEQWRSYVQLNAEFYGR